MKLGELQQLLALVEAKYQIRQQAFQSLLAKENALRNDLLRLETQRRAFQHEDVPDMRAIGADIIWNAWLGKAKNSLNMQLALVLAEKDQHIRQIQQAYGKVLATQELLDKHIAETRRNRQEAQLNQSIAQSALN